MRENGARCGDVEHVHLAPFEKTIMKDSMWFWVLGGVLLFMVLKNRGSTTTGTSGIAGTRPNTNTATTAPAPWLSTIGADAQAINGTASTVGDEVSTTAKGLFSIFGLFGNRTPASGTPSPTTSGSGAGVVNDSQAGDNSGSGSNISLSNMPEVIPTNVGYDQYGLNDFGSDA